MQLNPFTKRDFSAGNWREYSINSNLMPPNSVDHSVNVNFDTILGSVVVRPGTTKLGATVTQFAPLGLAEFVTPNAVSNLVVGAFKGSSTASIYFYDSSWHTSALTGLNNTNKVRFAELGGYLFMANGSDAMKSTTGGTTWGTTNCLITQSAVGLLIATKNRMLASGHPNYRSRVYFSSIISSTAAGLGVITWNENPVDGDWIDFSPGDGSNITGFAETSDTVTVFKGNTMYRINAVTTTVDTQNIFNIGAVSQEAIVECQGVVYFFSGQDIRQTSGSMPQQISRLGVQEWIDAIPQANWSSVAAGTDGFNVYFSIGTVTLNQKQDTQRTFSNVVLKFSTRDQTWSAHSYSNPYRFYIQFTQTATGRLMYGSEDGGTVQAINSGFTDNGTAIFYELKDEEDFGVRETTKEISDKIVVFSKYAQGSVVQIQSNDRNPIDVDINMSNRIAVSKGLPKIEGNFFNFIWYGNSTGQSPILEGYHIPSITDEGVTGIKE